MDGLANESREHKYDSTQSATENTATVGDTGWTTSASSISTTDGDITTKEDGM